jgi:uncharacterized protein (DUF697 family)
MVVAIARRLGVLFDEDGWKAQPQGSLAAFLASLVGRFAVGALGDFLKMIPGIGTVAGGSLNVAVAVGGFTTIDSGADLGGAGSERGVSEFPSH